MTTALELITSSMRKIGAITMDEAPSSSEANDALAALNDLLDSWSNNSVRVVARQTESFALTGGDGEYTIGSGADFDTVRPTKIIAAYVRRGTVDYPIEEVTDNDYANIAFKSIQSYPEFLNYDYAYPTGNIKMYPLPSAGDTLYLVSEKPLSNVSTLTTDISFPPGWERALKYNLAIDLAPDYGQPVSDDVRRVAMESLAAIERAIMRNRSLDVPADISGSNNIYSGWL